MTLPFIPFARPDYGPDELAALSEVAAGGWLTSGPRAAEFERDFKAYVGAAHASP